MSSTTNRRSSPRSLPLACSLRTVGLVLLISAWSLADGALTHKDIVDKDRDAKETVLSSKDFENAPKEEIDLRELGIDVPEDPTMGSKTEGDIAVPNVRRFMDDKPGLGRNAIRQSYRYDRDQYIDIIWPNVINGADDQFEKYGMNVIDQLNEPYDYASIMHYGPYAFSANGKRTIIPRKSGSQKMGQRVQFSEIDLRKINRLYQCGGRTSAAAVPAAALNTGSRNANTRPQVPTQVNTRYGGFGGRTSFMTLNTRFRPIMTNVQSRWATRTYG
ncbi:Metalloendopeptidase [Aphelenchoides fujianensis]|nr:Metalloendopeptidase [Aphelenchoides fujianensis]